MLSLPDADGLGSQGPKKIAIFKEGPAEDIGEGLDTEELVPIAESQIAVDAATSQDSNPGMTPSTSVAGSYEKAPSTPTEATPGPFAISQMKSRFSFASQGISTTKPNAVVQEPPTPASSAPRPSRIPLAIKSVRPSTKTLWLISEKSHSTTKIGSLCHKPPEPPMPMTPPLTPMYNSNSKVHPSLNAIKIQYSLSRSCRGEEGGSWFDFPTPQDEREKKALMQNGSGSEDLIIHDSEEEDPLSPIIADEHAGTSRSGFCRFAFAATGVAR